MTLNIDVSFFIFDKHKLRVFLMELLADHFEAKY
jgi:hypothetical protein